MNWLQRLKSHQTPEAHATKPTEHGFVGFVAPDLGAFGNSRASSAALRLDAANAAVVADRRAVVARRCAACTHLLPRGTCGKPIEAGLIPEAEGFGIAWPEPLHAAACAAFEAKTSNPTDRPYKLSATDAAVAHAEAWSDLDVARFQIRMRRLTALGFGEQDAEDLAEQLHLRDVHADYRVVCLECRHLAGTVATDLRCGNHKAAGVGRALPADLVTMFQSCAGFSATAP